MPDLAVCAERGAPLTDANRRRHRSPDGQRSRDWGESEHEANVRERIVRAAAEVLAAQGAGDTTLADVSAAIGASQSQLDRYFRDDHALIEAVVEYQCVTVVGWQTGALASVSNWEDLERWAELIVEQHGTHRGCPIGTLAAALSDTDEGLRKRLSDAFRAWSDAIRGALLGLRENGLLSADADLDALTTMTLAAIQGGLWLTKTSHDADLLRTALAGAIDELRANAPRCS